MIDHNCLVGVLGWGCSGGSGRRSLEGGGWCHHLGMGWCMTLGLVVGAWTLIYAGGFVGNVGGCMMLSVRGCRSRDGVQLL